jgi:uncharacterized protein
MVERRSGKTLELARFGAAVLWAISSRLLSASSARGITNRFNIDAARPLLSALFLLFLLGVGFALLQMIARRPATARQVLGLPRRDSAGREWLIGAALGWGMVVLAVLPIALAGRLHVSFWTEPGTLKLVVLDLLKLAVGALIVEVVFRGYPFRCLIAVLGPTGATLCMSVLFGLTQAVVNGATRTGILVAIWMGVVFSIAWLRTHGLWLGWGMRFAWTVSMGALFGLPVSGSDESAILVQTVAHGRSWLTGGQYGPEGAWFTAVALLVGLVVLVRVTRDYAWNYTHAPIVAGGYPMEAKPPAAHTAMEQQARPASLIQILPSAPQGRSVSDLPAPPPPPPPPPPRPDEGPIESEL